MDYLTVVFTALLALRMSNADGGLTKKSGTIIIAGGGGHPAPYPVPVPIPIPVHHGYHQNHHEYQTPHHYGHHHIQPYGQQYGQHVQPAQNTQQQYGHPNLIVLPIFTPRTHHEGYGFGESHNFGQYNFQGFDFRAK